MGSEGRALRMHEVDEGIRAWVRRSRPGSRLLRTWALRGGVSAQMTAFEIALPDGATQRLVLRQHGEADRAANPQVAANEFRLLRALHAAGLPVPPAYDLDTSGEILPLPYIVLACVEGEPASALPDAGDLPRQMAGCLAQIHGVDLSDPALSYLPQLGRGFGARPAELDASLQEGRIRDALEAAWPLAYVNAPALLHGDYWPGNVLWREGRIAAVVDWEDARTGDPLADVGNARLEMLWAFGAEATERFTEAYRSMMPGVDLTNLPYWDLCAALRPAGKLSGWGLEAAAQAAMRAGHRWFVERALEKLLVLDQQ